MHRSCQPSRVQPTSHTSVVGATSSSWHIRTADVPGRVFKPRSLGRSASLEVADRPRLVQGRVMDSASFACRERSIGRLAGFAASAPGESVSSPQPDESRLLAPVSQREPGERPLRSEGNQQPVGRAFRKPPAERSETTRTAAPCAHTTIRSNRSGPPDGGVGTTLRVWGPGLCREVAPPMIGEWTKPRRRLTPLEGESNANRWNDSDPSRHAASQSATAPTSGTANRDRRHRGAVHRVLLAARYRRVGAVFGRDARVATTRPWARRAHRTT